ncbi:MAG: mechanosensitive ion channel family protein [Bacteroidales bacterium]
MLEYFVKTSLSDKVDKGDLSDKVLEVARKVFSDLGISTGHTDLWDRILVFVVIILFAFLVYLLFNKLLIKVVHKIVMHTNTNWDRILYENKFFRRLFGFIPPVLILILLPLAFSSQYAKLLQVLETGITIYLIIIFARIMISVVQTVYDYYLVKQNITKSPYKGVVEMCRLIIVAIACLVIAGVLMEFKISQVLTTLSAFAAVFLLIFKDTLLGFIAGVQLAENKMIHIGDWIVVPNTLANGNVKDISILTVCVQNFDNTIVYVPAYMLVTNSFQNWIGMSESGVRRIKKSVLIDVHSIERTTPELLNKVQSDPLVQKYLSAQGIETLAQDVHTEQRALQTNLGLFRVWLRLMLEEDDKVSNEPYIIIQDLPAEGTGLPLNLNFFVNTTDWDPFEKIQSRIFEQVMSMLPEFNLRQFQFVQWVQSPQNPQLPPVGNEK